MSRNVPAPNYYAIDGDETTMAGLEVPTWDPATALLIGVILLEAVVLYVGYGGLERLLGPRIMRVLVGGDDSAGR